MNRIKLGLQELKAKPTYLKATLIVASVFLVCLVMVATGITVYRMAKHVQAIACEDCGGGGGAGTISRDSTGGTKTQPAPSGSGSGSSTSNFNVTLNRSCDTFSGGVCVINMTPGQEVIVHEALNNYTYPYSNPAGWPISGVTNFQGAQTSSGYTFTINGEAGGNFSCKPSPGTSQFPSLYSPEDTGHYGCNHDFRGSTTSASSSADYYLKVNSGTQPGDYHFQVINVRGIDTWGADFFSFIIRIPTPVVVAPSYNFTCDTSSQQKDPGQTATYTLRATSVDGFSGQVTVEVTSGLPAGAVAGTATINVPANSSGTAPLTITTDPATPAQTYDLNFRGSSSGYTPQDCPAKLIINDIGQGIGPSVTLTTSTPSVTNSSQPFTLSWKPANATSCDASANPDNSGWVDGSSKDPSPIPTGSSPHSQSGLTISATTVFSIHCHKAGFPDADKDVEVSFNPTYAFNVTPNSMSFSATQGSALPPAQNFTVTNNSTVGLTFTVSSDRSWLNLTPSGVNSVTVGPNGGTAIVTAQPNTTASLSPNPDTANVTFNSNSPAGSTAKPVVYTLNPPPGFTMDCTNINPNTSQTVIRGATASWTVPVAGRYGFNKTVTLSITDNYPANLTNRVDANVAFTGSPNPENKSGDVRLVTGATTQTGTFSTMKVTASAPGETSQQCTLPPLIVDAYNFDVTPNNVSFSVQKDDPLPAAKNFLITNNGTTSLTFTVTKTSSSTWFTMNGSSATSIGGITVGPNGGTAIIAVRPTSTSTVMNVSDNNVVFDGGPIVGTQTKSVSYDVANIPSLPATVTAQCATAVGGPYTSGPSPTCSLPAAGQAGYIIWSSTNSADGLCSVTPLSGDTMGSTSTAANIPNTSSNPPRTSALNNPPAAHQFRVTCNSATGGAPGNDTVTFNVPSGGAYYLKQSAKHAVAVNQPTLSTAQLGSLNINPCDGQGRVSDPTASFKEGDIVTFAVNICNTGTADLIFNGSGDNSHAIILTDVLGNLGKPSAGWNAQVSCGVDCQVGTVDDTSQPGKVIFIVQAKPGSPTNRLVSSGGVWTLFFNAVIRAPAGATQPYYYFTNCISDTTTAAMTVTNTPSAADVYHNITGSTFDIPGFCLQALFSRSGSAPDRHEIAP